MSSPKASTRVSQRPVTPTEVVDVDDQFDECDADGDRRIDFTEFSALLDRVGSQVPGRLRRKKFDAIDANRDGRIDRGEFREWLARS